MNYLLPGVLLVGGLIMSGCTPLGAVSMIGSTISRTVEVEQNKKAREPVNRRIAVSNVNLGVEYMRQGAYETALEKLNRAIEADSKYAAAYNVLGVLYQLLEDPVAAEKNFLQSLKLEPEDSSALNNYGQFLCKQGREAEAEEHFLAAAGNPFYTTPELAYTNAGSCAYLHKKTDIAVKYFQKSLDINPEMPTALSQMAEISFDRGEYVTARDFLDRYLRLASHTPKSLWLGIRIERRFGDVDKLASYSMLLRNKYPDTVEAELLRISDEYVNSVKPQKPEQKTSLEYPGQNKQPQVDNTGHTAVLSDTSGLLGEADLSFYPLLLKEKDLLGIE